MSIAVKIQNYSTAKIGDETIQTIQITKAIMTSKIYKDINNKTKKYLIVCSDSEIDAILACPFAMYIEEQENANCPILLTKKGVDGLFSSTATLLKNSWAKNNNDLFEKIYVIGGSNTVKDTCIGSQYNMNEYKGVYTRKTGKDYNDFEDNQLLKYTTEVIRIKGTNRYETSLKIAEYFNSPYPNYLFFCSGDNYVDGYSLAAAASYVKCPLILLPKDYSKSTYEDSENFNCYNLTRFLDNPSIQSSVKKVFIAGGSQRNFIEAEEAIHNCLNLTMPNSIERIAGQDRYDTSLSIAKEFKDFLESNNSSFYARNQILTHEMDCSKLIILGGSSDIIDCPVAPVLAVKYKCPLIINNYLLKPRLIYGYKSGDKFYREPAHTNEIVIGDTSTDTKSHAYYCDLTHSDDIKYYQYKSEPDPNHFIETATYPSIVKGYKDGDAFYTDALHTNLITPVTNNYYIDLSTSLVFQYDGSTYGNNIGKVHIDTSPAPRTYNIMSYLQIKRPQLIYCFTDYSIETDINGFSGQQFENFVSFYNGEIKVDEETNFDITVITPV